jgi:hypothetical protein
VVRSPLTSAGTQILIDLVHSAPTGVADDMKVVLPDPNDIYCPSSFASATLSDLQLILTFGTGTGSFSEENGFSLDTVMALLDAALRDLISRRPLRLLPGVKRQDTYSATLQQAFPALFAPTQTKAMADRARLIDSIALSINKCRRALDSPQAQIAVSARCTSEDERVPDEPISSRLFAALCSNTDITKREKLLTPLKRSSSDSARTLGAWDDLSLMTDHLSLLDDTTHTYSDPGQEDELFEELGPAGEICGAFLSQPQHSRCCEDLAESSSTGSFQDLTCHRDGEYREFDGRLNSDSSQDSGSFNSDPALFSPLSSGQYTHNRLENDVSTLMHSTKIDAAGFASGWNDLLSEWGLIGEEDYELTHELLSDEPKLQGAADYDMQVERVTQSGIATACVDLHLDPVVQDSILEDCVFGAGDDVIFGPAANCIFGSRIEDISTPDDDNVFDDATIKITKDKMAQRPNSTPGFVFKTYVTQSQPASIDEEKPGFGVDMYTNPAADACPSLGELLAEEKFCRDMWSRRRSRACITSPKIYRDGANDYLKGGGRGWSFKSRASDTQQSDSPPLAVVEEGKGSPADGFKDASYFSKRASVALPVTSAAPSPNDNPYMPRRGSLLRGLSRRSQSISDAGLLDLELKSIEEREVNVKRRRTSKDYEGREQKEEEEEEMLFG